VTVPRPRLDANRPFSRAQATAAGTSLRELRTTAYRTIFTGVYISSTVDVTPALRAAAALVPFAPDAFASHASAGRILALPLPTLPDEHVSVLRQQDRRSRPGITCHLARHAELMTVSGTRVTTCLRTFVDLAEILSLVDLVVVGDHLVRTGKVTLEQLRTYCARARGRACGLARRAAEYVRERVDSPMETRLRMLVVLAGLPEPEVNLTIRDVLGEPIRRYDLSWPAGRSIVEYDGRQHIEREEQWERDLERREAIDEDEWRMLVVTAKGIYGTPGRTLDRIHRMLLKRGVPGTPRRLSDDWKPHFPGRT